MAISKHAIMGLTRESTREEVLAAADEHERIVNAVNASLPDKYIACGRKRDPDRPLTGDALLLERQKTAGEEDQSVPGWDHGA